MTKESAVYAASAASPASSGKGLVSDVDRQPDTGLVGGGLQLRALGGGDPQADGLARILGGGSSGSALLGLGHARRIRATGTLDQGEYPCNANPMTSAEDRIREAATQHGWTVASDTELGLVLRKGRCRVYADFSSTGRVVRASSHRSLGPRTDKAKWLLNLLESGTDA